MAFYYLHSEAHPSSQLSIPPFGLTRPENYLGHIFWDADAWTFLPVVLSDPQAGRQMVSFRRRTLDAAERIASLYGCQGVAVPMGIFASDRWGELPARRKYRMVGAACEPPYRDCAVAVLPGDRG